MTLSTSEVLRETKGIIHSPSLQSKEVLQKISPPGKKPHWLFNPTDEILIRYPMMGRFKGAEIHFGDDNSSFLFAQWREQRDGHEIEHIVHYFRTVSGELAISELFKTIQTHPRINFILGPGILTVYSERGQREVIFIQNEVNGRLLSLGIWRTQERRSL